MHFLYCDSLFFIILGQLYSFGKTKISPHHYRNRELKLSKRFSHHSESKFPPWPSLKPEFYQLGAVQEQHGGLVVSTVPSQQEDSCFEPRQGPFCLKFACSSSCLHGFSLGTRASSNSPKTCILSKLVVLDCDCAWLFICMRPRDGPVTCPGTSDFHPNSRQQTFNRTKRVWIVDGWVQFRQNEKGTMRILLKWGTLLFTISFSLPAVPQVVWLHAF